MLDRSYPKNQVEPDPHKPLRQDVRLLGELLGDTLRARAARVCSKLSSSVRTVAKTRARARIADFQALAIDARATAG